MRILLTNDDGIRGEGLRILASWARELGEIVVYAPKTEQSACGQSITLRRPFSCIKSDCFSDLGIEAYEVDSTPADCVRIAYCLNGPFDLVFSGINNGFNTGQFIAYSGTLGAVLEAAAHGIPAVAFSTHAGDLGKLTDELQKVWGFFEEKRLLDLHSLYNVNISPGFTECPGRIRSLSLHAGSLHVEGPETRLFVRYGSIVRRVLFRYTLKSGSNR